VEGKRKACLTSAQSRRERQNLTIVKKRRTPEIEKKGLPGLKGKRDLGNGHKKGPGAYCKKKTSAGPVGERKSWEERGCSPDRGGLGVPIFSSGGAKERKDPEQITG